MAPKDFKPRSSRGVKAGRGKRPAWLYFFLGAVTGIVGTTLVYVNEFLPVPLYVAPGKSSATKSHTDPKVAAADSVPKPKFEFYTMLPEMEVAIPDSELPARSESGTASKSKPASDGVYFLQAGSFRLFEEADKMKANLAFLGLEAGIQTVTINGTDTWHRVRVGPFSDLASLNESRTRLRQNKVETIVLKVRK